MSKLEDAEEKIRALEAETQEKFDAQRAVDLEAYFSLKVEHGISNVAHVDLPYLPGLPTMVIVRAPVEYEVKRYRDRVRPPNGNQGDPIKAAEELASVCRVYPPKVDAPGSDLYDAVQKARPSVHMQLGVVAIKLAQGVAAEQGKG